MKQPMKIIRGMLRAIPVYASLLACLPVCWPPVFGQVFDFTVSPDGTGDYAGVQSALDAVPDNSPERTLIFVCRGTYMEKVILAPGKINVSLIGEDPETVRITWDDYAGKDGMSSADTYTFWADANDFYAENISFVNSAGAVGQALALRTTGDRMAFRNCRFIGHQDTYYAHKRRQYNFRCHVEGTTDFIYGDATTVFEQCTVLCKKGGAYISAPADTKLVSSTPEGTFYHGLLFRDCDVEAETGVSASSYYLGRPWQPNASSVFIECRLGEHIKPAGWSTWSGDNHLSGCFAEYRNTDPAGSLIDVSQRVSWSKQLTQEEVENYYKLSYFLKKDLDAWDPVPFTTAPETPAGLETDGFVLSWQGPDSVEGYLVYRNDSLLAETSTASYAFTELPPAPNDFSVRSVSMNGALSDFSLKHKIYGPLGEAKLQPYPFELQIDGDVLRISRALDLQIYSLSGILMGQAENTCRLDVSGLSSGIYLLKLKIGRGIIAVRKIIIHSERN